MKLGMLWAAAAGALLAGTCLAETISLSDGVAVRNSTIERPSRGMSMTAVESRFGQPATRHSAVGQPPITRWDYPGFAVYFEHQYVIHAVVTGG
ncbi:MAG TPA: hypothetical protein VLD59_17625 [Steroidobacteraceae bacterium]|nr:hypothetical protein [Steroidobacteraceae bacterium]